jgi:hypothetical protein
MFFVTATASPVYLLQQTQDEKPSINQALHPKMQHEYPLLSSIPKVDPVEVRDLVSKHLQLFRQFTRGVTVVFRM